mgnify:CR=1 FL=1|jgi:hypothetical protein
MDNVYVIRNLMGRVRESFLDVMDNVTQEVADWLPSGEAHPIRMSNLHLLWAEDRFINVFIKETSTVWADIGMGEKTGFQPGRIPNVEWARSTEVDIYELRDVYMPKLFASTDAYLSMMNSDDLDKPVKSDVESINGLPIGEVLIRFALHSANHIGEISSQKGTQGIKGYSF